MSDDLKARLRGLADCDSRSGEPLGKVMREAAAHIEALTARMQHWRREGDRAVHELATRIDALEAALAAMTQERDVALAAVQRFGDMADEWKDARDEAIRRRDAWRAKAEGFDEMAAAVRAKIKAEPATWSRILLRAALIESEARLAKAVEALRRIRDKRREMDMGDLSADEAVQEADDIARATLAEIGGA